MAVSACSNSVLGLAGILLLAVPGGQAEAACPVPPIAGTWKRAAPGPDQELVRLEIIHRCSPGQYGVHSVIDGEDWTLRASGACRPRNCNWGRAPGASRAPGEIAATFRTFSAYRQVRATVRGNLLEVHVVIDWHSENRKTDRSTVTFIRDE